MDNQIMKVMTLEEKKQLMAAASRYTKEKRTCGDLATAYDGLRDILKKIEAQYGVTIFAPGVPEGVLISRIAEKIEAVTMEWTGGGEYSCSFRSVAEANTWLTGQRNLTISRIQTDVSRVGLDIRKINITYKTSLKPVNNYYQITEQMKHRFFVGSKPETFRRKWEEQNPNCRFVFNTKHKWGFSLIGGRVGFFRYIKEKYIVLYTQKTVAA